MSILALHDVSLTLAGNRILSHVDWQIQPGDRVALVGRNGAGKSTLLSLLLGEQVADSGQIQKQSGLRVASLSQDVAIADNESVYHFLVKGLGVMGELLTAFRRESVSPTDQMARCYQQMDDLHAWDLLARVETMATRLEVPIDAEMKQLSGGMKRRVLLASALILEPDLLLLDEPTNHLDLPSIEWLESYLKNYSGSVLVVTHDRAFLAQVANRILEIDRGRLIRHDCSYDTYLDRREANRIHEQKQDALFDKRLEEEEAWIRTGIKARRTRNEGRVRALVAMRQQYHQRREALGKASGTALQSQQSGRIVIEASHLQYSLGDRCLIRDLSRLVMRGDKIGIIGPNGCGKTTLIRLLLGELTPDSGTIRQGTALSVAYVDQFRSALDEKKTLMDNVADGASHVTIQGKQKHVASYLRDFLFQPEQFNQPVSTLSGGERNRLLLMKLFAKPVNVLVMDEPTNDLDIETMELLETMLGDYQGTLLLVSHDRAFINQVVTNLWIYEGDGQFNEYIGGYEEYLRCKKETPRVIPVGTTIGRAEKPMQLSFQEQRELSKLPKQIEALEQRIAQLQETMATSEFYQQDRSQLNAAHQELAKQEAALGILYVRWEALEAKGGG